MQKISPNKKNVNRAKISESVILDIGEKDNAYFTGVVQKILS